MKLETPADLDSLDFEREGGLVPVVAQDARTGEVLMLAYADRAALERTLATGEMWYWSRSRQRLWRKGATSGNVQRLVELAADCDRDAVLARVKSAGPACHTGAPSCFPTAPPLAALARVLAQRAAERPVDSYTARLFADRNLRLKKLGEEAIELAVACADRGGGAGSVADAGRVAEEAADVVYHALVAALAAGAAPTDVLGALERRLPAGPGDDDGSGRA